MPTIIKRWTKNSLIDVDYQADTLADAGHLEPADGVYTITNTYYSTKVLKIDAHLTRLEDSAQRINMPLTYERKALRQILRQMITDSGFGDVRFRITVAPSLGDDMVISIEPFVDMLAELKTTGVRVISAPNQARDNARAKTTDWMHARKALTQAMPEGIYDTILEDTNGNLLEGLGANFYAIQDGLLYTAELNILHGISRQVVLEVAPDIIPVQLKPIHRDDISQLNEAFLTSSSRRVIPIIEINGISIASGKVGTFTKQISDAYNAWTDANLEEL